MKKIFIQNGDTIHMKQNIIIWCKKKRKQKIIIDEKWCCVISNLRMDRAIQALVFICSAKSLMNANYLVNEKWIKIKKTWS